MTVDDALARRTRAILLDAKAAAESAPAVAALMAKLMNKDEKWISHDFRLKSFELKDKDAPPLTKCPAGSKRVEIELPEALPVASASQVEWKICALVTGLQKNDDSQVTR